MTVCVGLGVKVIINTLTFLWSKGMGVRVEARLISFFPEIHIPEENTRQRMIKLLVHNDMI